MHMCTQLLIFVKLFSLFVYYLWSLAVIIFFNFKNKVVKVTFHFHSSIFSFIHFFIHPFFHSSIFIHPSMPPHPPTSIPSIHLIHPFRKMYTFIRSSIHPPIPFIPSCQSMSSIHVISCTL
jgi:hypothetical protein